MDLKGAEIRNVNSLCSKFGSKENISLNVNIPYYQRPYKWGKENIKNLIDDFYGNNCREYFVGSIVMTEIPNGRHDIIDGQQRITTMYLLMYQKFVLQRAYTEEMIIKKNWVKIESELDKLVNISYKLFGKYIGDDFSSIKHEIVQSAEDISQDDSNNQDLYNGLVSKFQKEFYLPEKNLSNEDEYYNKYYNEQKKLLEKADLSLNYSRGSYNDRLTEAMARYMVVVSDSKNPYKKINLNDQDELVKQYLLVLAYQFDCLCNLSFAENEKPLINVSNLIIQIDNMICNIKFCVIVTGNQDDAYTLFEVLNDRALEIEDLDLIKNLFYKWYCQHAKDETDLQKDRCIEEVDKIWAEDVFSTETGAKRAKLISYLAVEYFTADDTIKYNDNERYRKVIENEYLKNKEEYSKTDIKNDFYIYQMISILIKELGLTFQNINKKVLKSENDNSKSITYKAFHLLHALKEYGVIPALSNLIICTFVKDNIVNGEIQISKFQKFVSEIINDNKNQKDMFKDIHRIAFELRKYALLSSSAELPRQEAKRIISMNNVNKLDVNYAVSNDNLKRMQTQFENWISNWKYGNNIMDLKVKVLFLNLFQMEKEGDNLKLLSTFHEFRTDEIQLDHMEASKIDSAAEEKYFIPDKEGELRENYTDELGNFMILDSDNNNNKNNRPMQMAIKFYDGMISNHWLICEVKEMLGDDRYSRKKQIDMHLYRVPRDEFFINRKHRLISYFETLLLMSLDDKEKKIINYN